MPTERKRRTVHDLGDTMKRSNIIVVSDYRGLSANQLTTLRRKMRAADAEIKIVKNTLARLAAKLAGKDALSSSLEGPTAIAFGYGDVVAPVKTLAGFQTEGEGLIIKGGLLGNKLYGKDEILSLAALPSREVLLARVVGQMAAPISIMVGSIAAPMRGLLGILQSRMKQLEEK